MAIDLILRTEQAKKRFCMSIEKRAGDGCWMWIGKTDGRGYPKFNLNRICAMAHRVSYENLVGPIPPNTIVGRRCGTALCVNPKHLCLDSSAPRDIISALKFQTERARRRFWKNVHRGPECWEWKGHCRAGYAYGGFYMNGKNMVASRVVYENEVGHIPDGFHVCHHCDNPKCVRPDHLFAGTRSDNIRDCVKKGRFNKPCGSANKNSKLKEGEVWLIKKLLRSTNLFLSEVAKIFHVNYGTISYIRSGKTWRHVL